MNFIRFCSRPLSEAAPKRAGPEYGQQSETSIIRVLESARSQATRGGKGERRSRSDSMEGTFQGQCRSICKSLQSASISISRPDVRGSRYFSGSFVACV
jgi:hypothetical protein